MAAIKKYQSGTPCKECGQIIKIEAKGLCRKCYNRLWARKKSDGVSRQEYFTKIAKASEARKFGICKTCGRVGKIQSLEQCPRCYKKSVEVIITCSRCGRERGHAGLGLCHSCYVNTITNKRKTKKVICAICGQEKIHKAKGLCSSCYRNQYKKTWTKKIIICKGCGLEVEHEANGLCMKCYLTPERNSTYHQTRRARKSNLPATLTPNDWTAILEKYNYSCAYCGKSNCELQQEHWIPVSKGGGYTLDNIVPACQTCNSRKRTKTGDEFLAILQKEKEYAC